MNIFSKIKMHTNFPRKGIKFYDINPLYADKKCFNELISMAHSRLINLSAPIDYVVGIESRGFILGTAMAEKEFKGFIPMRKPNKLPGALHSFSYALEYGKATLNIQKHYKLKGKSILLVDDVLATGGTLNAAIRLLRNMQVKNIIVLVILDIGICKDSIPCDYKLVMHRV